MLPTMKIGSLDVTRLVVGSNPFLGKSHMNAAVSTEMKTYYTEERIFETLRRCEEAGINAVQARGSLPMMELIDRYNRNGGHMLFLCQTGKSVETYEEELDALMASHPAAVCIHGELADKLYLNGQIDRLAGMLDSIRRKNVPVGLCAHAPEVLMYAEEHNWKVDYYMASLYNLTKPGRPCDADGECFHDEDIPIMYDVIRRLSAPVIALKILGAGRRSRTQEDTKAAFEEAFASMKKGDGVLVGMFDGHIDQPRLDAEYTLAAIRKAEG